MENTVRDCGNQVRYWKQKYHRSFKKTETTEEKNVKKIMKQGNTAIKERLFFCEVLEKQLVQNKCKVGSQKEKTIYSRIVYGNIVKKNRCGKNISHLVNCYQQTTNNNHNSLHINRARKVNTIKFSVKQFLENYENSAICPGKKDIIKKNGKIFRKRVLQDTLTSLHQKFCKETKKKISLNTFLKYKPFWIIKSKMSARNTCLCKTHANFDLILQKLCKLKVVSSPSSRNFTELITCNSNSKACMYRECRVCINKKIPMPENPFQETFYYKWCQKNIERKGSKGLTYNVKVTLKEAIKCNINELVALLNTQTPLYLKHVYDTSHQLKLAKSLQQTLDKDEVFIVIDFSENYLCKYASEVQSVHFGASKKQISLHTGAFFYLDPLKNSVNCVSFCTVSECLRHDAASIWAHMKPVLNLIKEYVPGVKIINFQSDGPSTQYKNRNNFYLFLNNCKSLNIQHATWNFSTSGHGKSCADGIGGTVKGLCDRAVLHGKDIISVQDVVDVIKNKSKVNISLINEDDIIPYDELLKKEIKAAPNSMQIHQLIWSTEQSDKLFINYLSCNICYKNPPCYHYKLSPDNYIPIVVKKINRKKKNK